MEDSKNTSSGTTPTERLLFRLCRGSFLQLWSYANLFRDQGQRGAGDGKELCDVLVVFGDSVILFSDKSCGFPDSGKLEVDWGRWQERAVAASRRQLSGAERWVRQFPSRVFLDRRCTRPIPVSLPPSERMRVFKVAVALGAADRCRSHLGGSGSLLLLNPKAAEGAPVCANAARMPPFAVPMIEPDDQVFHVLDNVTLPVILQECGTIADFVEYLDTKERMIRSGQLLSAAGEEELVGMFLGLRSGLADVVESLHDVAGIHVGEGIYADILQRSDYRAYLQAHRSSYFWDYLIANHCRCVLDGTLVPGSVKSIAENEALLRLLALESRVNRGFLADAYLDLMDKAPRGEVTSRTVRRSSSDPLYVFQVHPRAGRDYDAYRRERQEYLHRYCLLAGWRNRDIRRIVGLVTEGVHPQADGYDLIALEFEEWTPEMIMLGKQLNRELAADVSRPLTRREIDPHSATAWGRRQPDRSSRKTSSKVRRPKKRKKRR